MATSSLGRELEKRLPSVVDDLKRLRAEIAYTRAGVPIRLEVLSLWQQQLSIVIEALGPPTKPAEEIE